jgi:hypothetical protein
MSLGDWPQPFDCCRLGRHFSQPLIAPQIARDILQFKRVDGMPLLLQPVRAGGNPKGCGHVFHGPIVIQLLYICTVKRYYHPVKPEPPIEEELAEMARRAGELAEGVPLRPTLLLFADMVSGRCAQIGDQYGDWDRNAGDHIRAVMHGFPGLMPKPQASD